MRAYSIKSILSFVLVLLCHLAVAQQQIRGTVTAPEGSLTGAVIKLLQTQLGAVTGIDGGFEIGSVPAGHYELTISYVGYEEKKIPVTVDADKPLDLGKIELKDKGHSINEVTIKGRMEKGSAMDAIHMTRASNKVVTVLSAENIGKLPDKNVAEAVQRVAGVKMERNKGEGSTVSLRGTPTDWTATLINGDRLPTADEDDPSRTFQFEVFPSSMVDYIVVTRTVTPDIEADNIGGAINFQTIAPPDKQKLSINLGTGANVTSGKPLYNMDFTYGNISKNKKFSYVVSGSYYSRNYAVDAMRLVYGSNYNHGINSLELKDYFGKRTTIGGNAALQYKPSDKLTFGAHFMHGRMDDDKWQYKTTYNWSDGSGERMRDIGTHGDLQRRLYGGDITSSWAISKKLTMDVKVASYYSSFQYGPFPYSKGDPRNGYMNYQFISDINPTFWYNDMVKTDFSGKIPADPSQATTPFKLIGADNPYGTGDNYKNIQPQPNYTPTVYTLEKMWSEINHTHESDPVAAQVNFTWKINDNLKLRAGGKFRYKEGSRDIDIYDWILNTANINKLTIYLKDYQLQDAPRSSSFLSAMSSAYENKLLPFMTPSQMSSFIDQAGNSLKGVPMDKYNQEYRMWVGSSYSYNETVESGYIMAEGNLGKKWKFTGGLRIENTHFHEESDTTARDATLYQVDSSTWSNYYEPVHMVVDRSYLAILPSLNANYSINSISDLRMAVSRTFHRPNFEETKPGAPVIRYDNLEYIFGNAGLKPTYSINFDAMYERYWGNKGLFTAGVYYKNVTDHIFTKITADADPVSGIIYKYYENAGNSYVMGAEASIDKQFNFLHGFWSGFGIAANITYSYSRMQVPGRPSNQAMTEQTPLLYNVSLYYEKGGVNTRLGLNYTGAYLKELNLASVDGLGVLHKDTDYDLFVDKMYSLDYQLSVKLNRRFSAYLEANNLLNAPYKTYIGQPWRPRRIEYYGPRLQVGCKFEL
ncbi:TonB-dependent receptor [Chitinophagaceae bacterium MMS25-I14]